MTGIYDICHAAGGMSKFEWERDPKRLGFILARYKFVAKMLEGKTNVLEVGCADGFCSRIVRQHVGRLTAIDVDARSILEAKARASKAWPIEFYCYDIVADGPMLGYDAVYALDVFEHIADEGRLLSNLRECAPVVVVGTPSLESQTHASELSRRGHVNCKSGQDLRRSMLAHWSNVFLFGMNDETLHTGFPPMAHYLLAVGVG